MVATEQATGSVALALGVGALAGLAAGAAVGLVNGGCVSWLAVNPFVVTLGTWNIVLALATTASGGRQIFDIPAELNAWFYRDAWFGIPPPVATAAALLALAWWILNRTVLGRCLYLIGGNPRAAEVAGLPSRRFTTLAYVLCSTYAALGALMLTARTGSGEPKLGGNLTLESIAAAVIGGVSLRGGEGTVLSPILGALFTMVLSNGMNLLRVDGYVQQMILGAVIIAAIFIDCLRRGRD
jgi:ribose transport system permease protein